MPIGCLMDNKLIQNGYEIDAKGISLLYRYEIYFNNDNISITND